MRITFLPPSAIFDNTSWKKAQTINFLIFAEKIKFCAVPVVGSGDWKRFSAFITDGPISIHKHSSSSTNLMEMLPLWYFFPEKDSFSSPKNGLSGASFMFRSPPENLICGRLLKGELSWAGKKERKKRKFILNKWQRAQLDPWHLQDSHLGFGASIMEFIRD